MNPLNWFCGFVQAALVTGILGSHESWIKIVLVIVVFLVLAFYCSVYVYFMLNDPNRLQSEKYNLSIFEATLLQGELTEKPVVTFPGVPTINDKHKAAPNVSAHLGQ